MLGIDTNILVRFLVRDDEAQFAKALRLIKREPTAEVPVFVSLLVLLETERVLRSRYGLTKAELLTVFNGLLEASDLSIEHEATLEYALYTWKDASAQFADCLIGAHHRRCGCRAIATFDTKAAKGAAFMLV